MHEATAIAAMPPLVLRKKPRRSRNPEASVMRRYISWLMFAAIQAIRIHHRPIRYLWTRLAAARRPALALGPTGCVSFDDVEPPALPGPEWVRVETALSGICGSDLSAITAHDSFTLEPFGAYPFTFGHENVGVVR